MATGVERLHEAGVNLSPAAHPRRARGVLLARPEYDAAAVGVVGAHGHADLVPEDDTDPVFSHLPGQVRENLMVFVDEDAELSSAEYLGHGAVEFDEVVFAHKLLVAPVGWREHTALRRAVKCVPGCLAWTPAAFRGSG